MKKLALTILLGLSAILSTAAAAETDTLFVRAKAGPTFFSNLDPVTSAFALGLDLGFRNASGFSLTGSGILSFEDSAYSRGVSTYAKSHFFGVTPAYAVSKGIVTLSFGLGLGVLSTTSHQGAYSSGAITVEATPDASRSRFALAPSMDLDFQVYSGMIATVGLKYVASVGDAPHAGFFAPMAGFGYQF